jgi:hypothetical protein
VPAFVIDPAGRTVKQIASDLGIPNDAFTVNSAGLGIARLGLGDDWFLLDGQFAQPFKGEAVIRGDTLTEDQIVDWIDFGEVRQLGPVKMFWGERNRREII